jgi:hypothetical protein
MLHPRDYTRIRASSRSDSSLNSCLLTHPICQQELRSCLPSCDTNPHLIFLVGAVVHLAIAVTVFCLSLRVRVLEHRYDQNCPSRFTLNLTAWDSERLYFYSELRGFQQNHFRFANSYSAPQMLGEYDRDPSSCSPLRQYPDSPDTLMPCGLLPNYFFNDSFSFSDPRFESRGITWDNEMGNLFKPPSVRYENARRPLREWGVENETLNEHFIVWMRTAKGSEFRKLWAKAEGVRNLTTLTVNVSCNFPSTSFAGERWIVLVRPGGLGGHNYFLSLANAAMAILCAMARFMRCGCRCSRRRKFPGTVSLLHQSRDVLLYENATSGECGVRMGAADGEPGALGRVRTA